MPDILHQLRQLRVVPVIVIDEPDAAIPLAAALIEGGLPCAEVTFRTAGAAESLRRMTDRFPDMLVGAGTVLSAAQVDSARDAGARFVVAPGLNPAMVERCLEIGMPVYPGVCTPTEIEAALGLGLTTVKFFPAEPAGGVEYLKAIGAPYPELQFMPTGGISREIVGQYLALPRVVACGGSWMAPPAWIRAGEFDRIRDETAYTMTTVGRMGQA